MWSVASAAFWFVQLQQPETGRRKQHILETGWEILLSTDSLKSTTTAWKGHFQPKARFLGNSKSQKLPCFCFLFHGLIIWLYDCPCPHSPCCTSTSLAWGLLPRGSFPLWESQNLKNAQKHQTAPKFLPVCFLNIEKLPETHFLCPPHAK